MNEEDLSGKTIEGYHVIRPIGQGKFATVYKAETPDNKIVALKKIKVIIGIFEMNDPKLRDKCLKEVRLMQQLEHPNIIKYLDSFISNNELIIITEWAEKGDLKKLLKNAIQSDSPIEENKIWDFMYQIGSALKHMHDKRIMHRDLKPANIFLSADDTLKVGDFGLGRVFSEETVEAYSKVGTPLYMSPELLIGQGYDMRSDVWSLGCIIYEMCENKSPFRNDNDKMSLMDLFNNITKGEYKPVSMKFSDELRKIIQEMIIVDPQKRCDISQVIDACNFWKEKQKATLKIDCLIVMEDISEKLNLLDYRSNFCFPKKRECISKVFFATSEVGNKKIDKFSYFIDLAFWLIDLLKSQAKPKSKSGKDTESKPEDTNPRNLAKKLLDEVKKFGITLDPPITPEQLITGYGDAPCFILNELLNRQLITINFKFHTPSYNKFDIIQEVKGESDIKEFDEDKLFKEDPNAFDSDDDEKDDKTRLISNTTYYSNSTSATSTITDHMYKNNKKNTIENGLKDIDENQMMELDSIEWGKEIDRVGQVLEEFNEKIQKSQIENIIGNNEDSTQLEKIKLHSRKTKELMPLLRSSSMHRKLQEWDSAVINIQKGEKRINDACAHLTDNLRDIVHQKKQVYERLSSRTEKMKEKITFFDELSKKYNKVNQTLAEKDQEMLGENKQVALKNALERVRNDIKDLETKAEIIKTFLSNRRAHKDTNTSNKVNFEDDLVQ